MIKSETAWPGQIHRLSDTPDPSTVKRIFPDHPESVLGKEVKFLGAILTITHEQVTKGIRKRLTWLSDYPEPHLVNGGFSSDPPLSQIFQHGFLGIFPNDKLNTRLCIDGL